MKDTKYTEEQIEWALEELRKKDPKWATKEQAISLLDTLKGLPKIVVNKIAKDRVSGKLKPKN